MVNNFEDLEVWQRSHELTLMIYKITKLYPAVEKFGLISQMCRAAVSVENNIAEGFGRRTTKDYTNFLYKSYGSLLETKSMTKVSLDIGYINNDQFNSLILLIKSIHMMLNKLIATLQKRINPIT